MCKAISEGGQRCFGHARDAWEKARGVADRMYAGDASNSEQRAADALLDLAEADLTSTEKGRAFLVQQWAGSEAWLDSQADQLIQSVQTGMALQTIHRDQATVAAQAAGERDSARAKVAHRAQVAAASLRRAAKISALMPLPAAMGYIAVANPSPEAAMATGLALVGVGAHAWFQNGRTAPVDRRTTEDRARYERAVTQTEYDYRGNRRQFLIAAEEVLRHLDRAPDAPSAEAIRRSVLKAMDYSTSWTRSVVA